MKDGRCLQGVVEGNELHNMSGRAQVERTVRDIVIMRVCGLRSLI